MNITQKLLARRTTGAAIALTTALLVAVSFGLDAAMAHSPEAVELLQKGDQAMDEGNLPDAAKAYQQVLVLEPKSADAHNQLGLCYSRQGMLVEAAGEFKKALDTDPLFLPSLNNLGTVYYRRGNYDQAITFYAKALDLKRGADAELNTNLASVYRDRATFVGGPSRDDDFKLAVSHYEQALKDNPDFPQGHNNFGLCLFRLKRFDEAVREIHRAIQLKKDYSAAYYNLGLVEQVRNRMAEALTAYQQSLRYETLPAYAASTRQRIKELGVPTGSEDHFEHGFDLLSQHQWKEAESEFRQTVASGAGVKNAISWNNLGYALAKQARYREAIAAYKKASALLPGKFPAALYNLGQVLRTTGDLPGAEQCFKKALTEAHGTHALAHNALGLVLKQKGDATGAQAQYKLALLQSGDTLPVVHYNLGLLYEGMNKKKEAAEEYKTYLTEAPDGYNSPAARAKAAQLGQ
jgi:tetratricopeptide (TPR) repeat protein